MCDGILSCPFCGGDNLFVDTELDYEMRYVTCLDCDAFGPMAFKLPNLSEPLDGPIDAWNTRAERTCKNSYVGGCTVEFKCSACGEHCFYPKKGNGKYVTPRYCPNCGARVVR